ncbi:MAG TPA: aldo/keto reductase [Steroidobacteraceae bacterium]|nr:aldo/keto reductase [Steroidobacteraceae bacterium]
MDTFITSAANVRVPRIIYGTAWKKSETAHLVAKAIRQGFRGIDTACQPKHYDEPGVGAGVALSLDGALVRADLYLQSKFTSVSGQDPRNVPYDPNAPLPEQVTQSFAASLRNLQTAYLDCLVLHSPLASPAQTLEVWRAMESLVTGGGVRQLGISNCYGLEQLKALYASARIKPSVVQNRLYAETGYDREIRAFCRDHRIIYQSFWTLTANPHVLEHATVAGLASKYGRTPAQVLFRYLTQREVVPLTGTRSEAHMRADLAIFEFELEDRELDAMDALL